MDLIERIQNALSIYKNKFIIIAIICLLSSYVSVVYIPSYVSGTFTPEIINSQIETYFAGGIDVKQVLLGLVWMLQLSTISSFLLVIGYIFKYSFDKRIFNIKKWQDWKFFLYLSVVPIVLVDLIKKAEFAIGLNLFNDMISSFIVTLICSLLIVVTSAIILDKEEKPISINIQEIEAKLMEGGDDQNISKLD